MKVKIMQRSVYHKYAEIEIQIPNDWNIHTENINHFIHDYLIENENLYVDKIDKAIQKAPLEFGTGIDDYSGMNEPESESEWRFELSNGFGGHL